MKKLGIIGQRGMVGSVLVGRMKEENDFSKFDTYFFSTSQVGQAAPDYGQNEKTLLDAHSIDVLKEMDIIITCQGGDYTKKVHAPLRSSGWAGYWIDAASALRMDENAVIALDPVNLKLIENSLESGIKDYIGSNCTVGLLLMAIGGLFKENAVEWITSMTYQAASGAGARNMIELLKQMKYLGDIGLNEVDRGASILEIDQKISESINNDQYPKEFFGSPLAGSLIPWIDTKVENGQSREEWKAQVEANKILNTDKVIPIDGTCVRIGAMRCHSQALTIKLNKDISIDSIEQIIRSSNDWVDFVQNDRDITASKLSPATYTGTLNVGVGRVRKMTLGDQYLNLFTVGDQLLWGAAEPLRRMALLLK